MSQPSYSSAVGYGTETFFTMSFDVALDAANPPALSAFDLQLNGAGVSATSVSIDSAAKTVTLGIGGAPLVPGDVINFIYSDPTAGNDVNAIQGTDGADAANFSGSITILGPRPGPSAPATPTLNAGSDSGTVGDGITNHNTPTLSGTAGADNVVKLYDTNGTTLLGTTTADGSGNWSITSSALGDGSHTLKVTQTDSGNNTSALSTGLSLDIDTTASAPTSLAVAAGSDSGTLGDGISNVGTPQITGHAEANATVRLYDTDGTTLLGTATANGSGNWSITTSNLTEGSHTLTAKQTDVAGNVSAASADFTYIHDTVGPTGMALSTTTVNQTSAINGATVATLSSSDLTSVTYGFQVGNGTIDADNGKFTISGTSLVAAQNLTAGTYHIYLSATDAAGNDAFQIFTITVNNAPGVSSIVRAGAAGAAAPASADTITYTVTFDQAVTGVDANDFQLTPSGTAAGTVGTVSGSGSTYTVTVTGITGDGTLRLDLKSSGTGIQNGSAVATGSGYTSGQTYRLDHTAPSAPSVPAMTAGTDTGVSGSDAVTSNTTPAFTGTGEANAAVTLYDSDGTTVLGTATADGSGTWSITSSALTDGTHTLTAKQTDLAGNHSAAGSGLSLTIDTTVPTAPGAPALAAASDSGVLGDDITTVSAPVLTGTAEAHATIKLYDTSGTTLLGTATADGTGHWSVTSSSLSEGSHSLTATQTDAAGNVSSAGAALALTIEQPPAPPADTIDGVAVTQQPVALPGGGSGTETVIPIVTSGRVDSTGGGNMADIPLATSGGSDLLVAHLPQGYGLTATGGASQPAGDSLAHLIQSIIAATPDNTTGDQGHLTGDGTTFLQKLTGSVPLLVQTIAPVTAATAAGTLTLTGTSTDSQHTALVIDATHMAAGSSLQLESVDFAAIVGTANVTGNTTGQILTGDAAAQTFAVTAGSSSEVFSGGGDDRLAITQPQADATRDSAADSVQAVTTVLHGGLGNDTALFSGARSDYTIDSHEGYVVVTANAQPSQHTLLINVESLQFDDSTAAVQKSAALSTLDGLYESILGRQGDYLGVEFLGDAAKAGTSLGQLALDIMTSPESQAKHAVATTGDAAHDVGLLYQTVLDRSADAAGLSFWVDKMAHGASLAQVAQYFVASPEFSSHIVAVQNWDFQMS